MDMRKYGAGFVRPEDVRDGPRQEKIVNVFISEKFKCPVLDFESGDQLSLNMTNTRAMNRAYTTESDNWLEQEVELSLGHYTDYSGQTPEEKETVLLRPVSVRQPSADNGGTKVQAVPRLPSRRDDLDDDIPFN
jgi:hypothetical protein